MFTLSSKIPAVSYYIFEDDIDQYFVISTNASTTCKDNQYRPNIVLLFFKGNMFTYIESLSLIYLNKA